MYTCITEQCVCKIRHLKVIVADCFKVHKVWKNSTSVSFEMNKKYLSSQIPEAAFNNYKEFREPLIAMNY